MVEELLDTEFDYPQTNGILELRETSRPSTQGPRRPTCWSPSGPPRPISSACRPSPRPATRWWSCCPTICRSGALPQLRHGGALLSPEGGAWLGARSGRIEAMPSRSGQSSSPCATQTTPPAIFSPRLRWMASWRPPTRVGAWILADEVYSGAERLTDVQTPSFWGRYDKVLAVGSLSKAYALPGLRIGWVVAPGGHGGRSVGAPRVRHHRRHDAIQQAGGPRSVARGAAPDHQARAGLCAARLPRA